MSAYLALNISNACGTCQLHAHWLFGSMIGPDYKFVHKLVGVADALFSEEHLHPEISKQDTGLRSGEIKLHGNMLLTSWQAYRILSTSESHQSSDVRCDVHSIVCACVSALIHIKYAAHVWNRQS